MPLTIDLPPELERRLREQAARRGQEIAEYVQQALQALVPPPVPSRLAWQELLEIGRHLPEDERARLPADGPQNLDHYLYGAPRAES